MKQQGCTALPELTELCRDEIEVLAISIGRFVIAGYVTGDVACWDAGHDRAEHVLGLVEGPRLVASIAAVIRALRAERSEPWRFMPANCCRLTHDEIELVRLLGLGRLGDQHAIAESAARLTGCASAPRLVATIRNAGEVMNGLQSVLTRVPTSPRPERAILH